MQTFLYKASKCNLCICFSEVVEAQEVLVKDDAPAVFEMWK